MIALLTDFGASDIYAGVMKGVIASIAPDVLVIDLSHAVPRHAVGVGALWLDAAWRYFPERTVFCCVVDPGVGTRRRAIAVRTQGRLFVGPDNGLLGLLPPGEVREITADWGLAARSRTFHGRDVFAPVAARLASGAAFEDVGAVVGDPVTAPVPRATGDRGEVLWADGFGNLVTNLAPRPRGAVTCAGRSARVVEAYGDAPPGSLVALAGSSGRLEICVVEGDAAALLGATAGSTITWAPT